MYKHLKSFYGIRWWRYFWARGIFLWFFFSPSLLHRIISACIKMPYSMDKCTSKSCHSIVRFCINLCLFRVYLYTFRWVQFIAVLLVAGLELEQLKTRISFWIDFVCSIYWWFARFHYSFSTAEREKRHDTLNDECDCGMWIVNNKCVMRMLGKVRRVGVSEWGTFTFTRMRLHPRIRNAWNIYDFIIILYWMKSWFASQATKY